MDGTYEKINNNFQRVYVFRLSYHTTRGHVSLVETVTKRKTVRTTGRKKEDGSRSEEGTTRNKLGSRDKTVEVGG